MDGLMGASPSVIPQTSLVDTLGDLAGYPRFLFSTRLQTKKLYEKDAEFAWRQVVIAGRKLSIFSGDYKLVDEYSLTTGFEDFTLKMVDDECLLHLHATNKRHQLILCPRSTGLFLLSTLATEMAVYATKWRNLANAAYLIPLCSAWAYRPRPPNMATVAETICTTGDLKWFELLFSCGFTVNKPTSPSGENLFHQACRAKSVSAIEWLLQMGAQVNYVCATNGRSAIHFLFDEIEDITQGKSINTMRQTASHAGRIWQVKAQKKSFERATGKIMGDTTASRPSSGIFKTIPSYRDKEPAAIRLEQILSGMQFLRPQKSTPLFRFYQEEMKELERQRVEDVRQQLLEEERRVQEVKKEEKRLQKEQERLQKLRDLAANPTMGSSIDVQKEIEKIEKRPKSAVAFQTDSQLTAQKLRRMNVLKLNKEQRMRPRSSKEQRIANAQRRILHILFSHGFDIHQTDDHGITAVHVLTQKGSLEQLELVLRHDRAGWSFGVVSETLGTPLHVAIERREMNILEALLNHWEITGCQQYGGEKFSLNVQDLSGVTALAKAARIGYLDGVKILVDAGASIEEEDLRGETALWAAVRAENTDIVRFLLECGANVEKQNHFGETILGHIVRHANYQLLSEALSGGADVNLVEPFSGVRPASAVLEKFVSKRSMEQIAYAKAMAVLGHYVNFIDESTRTTPLYNIWKTQYYLKTPGEITACAEAVALLIANGAAVDVQYDKGETLMHIDLKRTCDRTNRQYAKFNHLLMLLMQAGASWTILDDAGNMALHYAARTNTYFDLMKSFLTKNQLKETKAVLDSQKRTVFHNACLYSQSEIAKWAYVPGAHNGIPDVFDRTALHDASRNGLLEIVKVLAKDDIDIRAEDKDGQTPLHDACVSGHAKAASIANFLIEEGSHVNAKDVWGRIPLHYACQVGSWECVEVLLSHGTEIEVFDMYQITPLKEAEKRGHQEVLYPLLTKYATDRAFMMAELWAETCKEDAHFPDYFNDDVDRMDWNNAEEFRRAKESNADFQAVTELAEDVVLGEDHGYDSSILALNRDTRQTVQRLTRKVIYDEPGHEYLDDYGGEDHFNPLIELKIFKERDSAYFNL